ncbi:piwi domain-containing protein [Aphelenchoides avenae]|nr:piwi domain-containing protein [Aphelenchus avenae]
MPSKTGVKEYFVVADQRVLLEKMHTELSQKLIKENAVLPQQRMANVMEHVEAVCRLFSRLKVLSGHTLGKLKFCEAADDEGLPARKGRLRGLPRGVQAALRLRHRHQAHFRVERDGRLDNMLPGSVVEEKFTRTDCTEFSMQSHNPIQGTGKAVPVNETDITRDQLQALLNALCFDHQIVTSSISLPEPVYQGDELAKRGFSNYEEIKSVVPQNIPKKQQVLANGPALTTMLCYMESDLKATSFTA